MISVQEMRSKLMSMKREQADHFENAHQKLSEEELARIEIEGMKEHIKEVFNSFPTVNKQVQKETVQHLQVKIANLNPKIREEAQKVMDICVAQFLKQRNSMIPVAETSQPTNYAGQSSPTPPTYNAISPTTVAQHFQNIVISSPSKPIPTNGPNSNVYQQGAAEKLSPTRHLEVRNLTTSSSTTEGPIKTVYSVQYFPSQMATGMEHCGPTHSINWRAQPIPRLQSKRAKIKTSKSQESPPKRQRKRGLAGLSTPPEVGTEKTRRRRRAKLSPEELDKIRKLEIEKTGCKMHFQNVFDNLPGVNEFVELITLAHLQQSVTNLSPKIQTECMHFLSELMAEWTSKRIGSSNVSTC